MRTTVSFFGLQVLIIFLSIAFYLADGVLALAFAPPLNRATAHALVSFETIVHRTLADDPQKQTLMFAQAQDLYTTKCDNNSVEFETVWSLAQSLGSLEFITESGGSCAVAVGRGNDRHVIIWASKLLDNKAVQPLCIKPPNVMPLSTYPIQLTAATEALAIPDEIRAFEAIVLQALDDNPQNESMLLSFAQELYVRKYGKKLEPKSFGFKTLRNLTNSLESLETTKETGGFVVRRNVRASARASRLSGAKTIRQTTRSTQTQSTANEILSFEEIIHRLLDNPHKKSVNLANAQTGYIRAYGKNLQPKLH